MIKREASLPLELQLISNKKEGAKSHEQNVGATLSRKCI
jgi:hypothetical protein